MTRAQLTRLLDLARGKGDPSLRLLEGRKNVQDALDQGSVLELWVREDLRDTFRGADVEIGTGGAKDFSRLGHTVTPQGVVAVVEDPAKPLDDVVQRAGLLVWLDAVQDPGNVGALVRSAAAFGASGVLVGEGSADPVGPKALRASAGHALTLPFARAETSAIAEALKGRDTWCLEAGGDDLFEIGKAPDPLVLLLGSEGQGVSREARGAATRLVGVPIRPEVESLNVSVAGAVALALLSRSVR